MGVPSIESSLCGGIHLPWSEDRFARSKSLDGHDTFEEMQCPT